MNLVFIVAFVSQKRIFSLVFNSTEMPNDLGKHDSAENTLTPLIVTALTSVKPTLKPPLSDVPNLSSEWGTRREQTPADDWDATKSLLKGVSCLCPKRARIPGPSLPSTTAKNRSKLWWMRFSFSFFNDKISFLSDKLSPSLGLPSEPNFACSGEIIENWRQRINANIQMMKLIKIMK